MCLLPCPAQRCAAVHHCCSLWHQYAEPLPLLRSKSWVAAGLQIGAVLDLLGEPKAATEWFERLHSHLPQDPGVLARLGALHAK